MDHQLTILNYHYVRPLRRTRFPEIKGCNLEEFLSQIMHLKTYHTVITVDELIDYLRTNEGLPGNAALLTFDDGFADHFDYVLPVLHSMELSGCFYPPAAPVLEHRLLDVHKVHFLLAGGPDPGTICAALDDMITERNLGDVTEFAKTYKHPSPRDSAEVIYVKRMLQKGLSAEARSTISSELFAKYVSADEHAFAEELYCSLDQLRLMASLGMHIGSHGYEHRWLSTLDVTDQQLEIDKSKEFLKDVYGQERDNLTICYPYGDHNDATRNIARNSGFVLGLADHHGIANLASDDHWALPRVSTSDFLIA